MSQDFSFLGPKVRERSPSFSDHYSQATLFWNSQTEIEKEHIVEAAHFELGKVETMEIRKRMIDHFNRIDHDLAIRVARGINVPEPPEGGKNHGRASAALSMEKGNRRSAKTRKVAVLAADGLDASSYEAIQSALKSEGVECKVIAKFAGKLKGADGKEVQVDKMFVTTAAVLFDAVLVPDGKEAVETLARQGDAVHFIYEAYRHCKPVAAFGQGVKLIERLHLPNLSLAGSGGGVVEEDGVVSSVDGNPKEFAEKFLTAIAQHRHWNRRMKDMVPA